MKKSIRKLIYGSLVAFVGMGIVLETEARVTKEIAEAVLPYLMKAAGIPEDPAQNATSSSSSSSSSSPSAVPNYSEEKKQAILSMIYTDEGQQQMVGWAKNGVFPPLLTTSGFDTENLHLDRWIKLPLETAFGRNGENLPLNFDAILLDMLESANMRAEPMLSFAVQMMRDAYIGTLFPCGPGTFSSFAAHSSRLGYHALTTGSLEPICSALLTGKNIEKLGADCQEIIKRLHSLSGILDSKIISIIFILDICNGLLQIENILERLIGQVDKQHKYDEYACRPVSATASEIKNPREGDCVETLFKHIIAIAIQKDTETYLTQTLPEKLKVFFKKGVSGEMNLKSHSEWKNELINAFLHSKLNEKAIREKLCNDFSSLNFQKPTLDETIRKIKKEAEEKISKGSVKNIVNVLEAIAFYNSSEMIIVEGDDAGRLTTALNKLARTENFVVKIVDKKGLSARKDIPSGISSLIEITDKKWRRLITVGIWEQEGHAEIISIKKQTFMGLKPGFLK